MCYYNPYVSSIDVEAFKQQKSINSYLFLSFLYVHCSVEQVEENSDFKQESIDDAPNPSDDVCCL